MGRARKSGRNVTGILLLNKPYGMSSNAALQRVKTLFKARKAGHTGSLDPLATGMLPVCLGEATKVSAFLLDADKRYQVTCKLGVTTATGDIEGEVLQERPVPTLDPGAIEAVLADFRGEIQQIPPMYSALKHKGERLYNLARQGVEVEREPRGVTIYTLTLLSRSDEELEFDVSCSKGTYIRTLIEDIGEKLGCGAHVTVLHRLEVGPFDNPQAMKTLEELEQQAEQDPYSLDDWLLPVDSALKHWPEVRLDADSAYYLRQGQAVMAPDLPAAGMVRVYEQEGGFIGVGEITPDGRVAPRRMFQNR